MGLTLFENTDLAGDRPGVAHVLNIGYFVATAQLVELAAQYAIAVEVDQPAFLGHQKRTKADPFQVLCAHRLTRLRRTIFYCFNFLTQRGSLPRFCFGAPIDRLRTAHPVAADVLYRLSFPKRLRPQLCSL